LEKIPDQNGWVSNVNSQKKKGQPLVRGAEGRRSSVPDVRADPAKKTPPKAKGDGAPLVKEDSRRFSIFKEMGTSPTIHDTSTTDGQKLAHKGYMILQKDLSKSKKPKSRCSSVSKDSSPAPRPNAQSNADAQLAKNKSAKKKAGKGAQKGGFSLGLLGLHHYAKVPLGFHWVIRLVSAQSFLAIVDWVIVFTSAVSDRVTNLVVPLASEFCLHLRRLRIWIVRSFRSLDGTRTHSRRKVTLRPGPDNLLRKKD